MTTTRTISDIETEIEAFRDCDISDLVFHQLPVDAGQIVDVSYATDEDWLYCRTLDRSDNSESITCTAIDTDADEDDLRFEPQNGLLPETTGEELTISSDALTALQEEHEAAQAVRTLRVWDDGSFEEIDVEEGDDYADIARDHMEDGEWGDGDYCVSYSWEVTDYDGDVIDSGSGEITGETEEPDCTEADEHDWTSEHEGGCTENPGVWSVGGTAMVFVSHCKCCGMKRTERTTGSQKNPGECDTTEYSDPDGEWVDEHYPSDDEEADDE